MCTAAPRSPKRLTPLRRWAPAMPMRCCRLGIQPVAIVSSNGPLPWWVKEKISGTPAIMNFIDTNAIQAAKPDLIIATGDLDDATYQKLQGIAPTQLQWIARILGRP